MNRCYTCICIVVKIIAPLINPVDPTTPWRRFVLYHAGIKTIMVVLQVWYKDHSGYKGLSIQLSRGLDPSYIHTS